MNELKKSEQAVLAAKNELGIRDNEEEFVIQEEGGAQANPQNENQTPLPTPMTADDSQYTRCSIWG